MKSCAGNASETTTTETKEDTFKLAAPDGGFNLVEQPYSPGQRKFTGSKPTSTNRLDYSLEGTVGWDFTQP